MEHCMTSESSYSSHVWFLILLITTYLQELQQARQQQTLGDLRKALSEVKVDAQKRLSDYQREVSDAEKEVVFAEKKLAKFKESMEKALDQKRR